MSAQPPDSSESRRHWSWSLPSSPSIVCDIVAWTWITSPATPASSRSRRRLTAGSVCMRYPAISGTPASRHAATSRRERSSVASKGFSHKTAFPCSAAAATYSKWVAFGVATYTASYSSTTAPARNSAGVTPVTSCSAATASTASASTSVTTVASVNAERAIPGSAHSRANHPSPTMATRTGSVTAFGSRCSQSRRVKSSR